MPPHSFLLVMVLLVRLFNNPTLRAAMAISPGVYFLRGYFVNVEEQLIILSQNSRTPSFQIGFNVLEEIISADVDPSLGDNSKGFNNYTYLLRTD